MDETRNIVSTTEFNLPAGSDPDWQAKSILYCRIAVTLDGDDGLQMMHTGGTPLIKEETDIGVFIQSALDDRIARMAAAEEPDGVPSPLSFAVKEDCYVVLELDTTVSNWQFRATDAVTLADEFQKRYFDLQYVDDRQTGQCCIVYFSARVFTGGNPLTKDKINFHVDFMQKNGKPLKICIDPDVENPGNPPKGNG